MDAETFGTFIQARRKALNLTQAELAEMLHVTDKAVSRWERGVGFPDIHLLEPLAEALQVSLLELMQSQNVKTDTVPKDTADAAVAGALEIAQTKRRNVRRSVLWWLAYLPVCAVMLFFTFILTFFVDIIWVRSVGIYLTVCCGSLAMNAISRALDRRLNPDIPVKRRGWSDCFTWGTVFLCGLTLLLSFPIRNTFGPTACNITRLLSILPPAGLGIYHLHRYIKSMPDG